MQPRTRSLLLCVALLACDGPPTATPPPQPVLAGASSVTPGVTATVRGRGLSGESTILVDGTPVPLTATSDSGATFVMPELRPCDTDGRRVSLALARAPSAVVQAELHLASTFSLAVGESRVLSASDLAGCVQLAAAEADYVVSALNPSRTANEQLKVLGTLTAWPASDPAPPDVRPARAAAIGALLLAPHRLEADAPATAPLPWPAPYSLAPRLFDPAYATAQPGDTVHFVDWNRAGSCDLALAAAPSYPAVVAAVSGLTVIAVDVRLASAGDYLTPSARAFLQRAAEIADPLVVPTMRRVFDPGYQPLPAAGGRHYHVVSAITGVARSADGNTSKPQSVCPLASEVVTTLVAPPALDSEIGPRVLATGIVHEYAHNADEVIARRHGRLGGSLGWMQEAWAVNAEETAARVSLRSATRVRLSGLGAGSPFRAGTTNSDWGLYPQRSPWTGAGAYKQGAALISFARELAGEAALDGRDPQLYLHLLTGGGWSLDALAGALGTSPESLLDAWALADATDDLSTAASPLARLASWDDTERVLGNEGPRGGSPAEARPSRTVRRSGSRSTTTLAAAPGSYAAAYLFSEGTLGLTIQVSRPVGTSAVLRITRTR